VPTGDELRDFIVAQSNATLPRHPRWAITARYYDLHKPDEWCYYHSILRRYRYQRGVAGWRKIVRDVCGRIVPSQSQRMTEYPNDDGKISNKPLTAEERMPRYIYDATEGFGVFNCYVMARQVRLWHPQLHAYVPVAVYGATCVK
jgi:hypothetical protein